MREPAEARDERRIDDALLARTRNQAWFHRYPRGWPFLLFVIIGLGTVTSLIAIERADRQTRTLELDRNATEIASGLQRRTSENIALMRAVAALFASSDTVTPAQFTDFVRGLYGGEMHGARGIGWAPVVSGNQVAALQAETRRHGAPGYTVHPLLGSGRRVATPVLFLVPGNAANNTAIGFDMYSEPVRRAAMDKASRIGQPVASGRLSLLIDVSRPQIAGFIIYVPVFRAVGSRHVVKGFVYSPFRAGEFLDSAAELYGNRQVEIALYDQVRDPGRLLALRTRLPAKLGFRSIATSPSAGDSGCSMSPATTPAR